jgi:hypothetical protein
MINLALIEPITQLAGKLIDRIFPDKLAQAADRAKAEFEMTRLLQDGSLKQIEVQMSAILAEAQSSDPWTSRARPTFLYVMYIMILMGIPMGVLYIFNPAATLGIASGLNSWLSAIPDALYALFGAGYLGYTGMRGWEKKKGLTK